MIQGLPLLKLSGSPGEMGVLYGKMMRELIGRNLNDYLRRFRDMALLSDADIHHWGEVFRRLTSVYKSSIADMLDGIADGAGVENSHIYALNARTELLYGAKTREDACTSIAALPEVTANHHTLLGQNWDWHPEQSEVSLVLATRDEEGLTAVTLAEAGMLAKCGLNSEGIGVAANILGTERDYLGEGVPYHILLRGVLESKSMAYALRAAVNHPRVSSGNFLIADAGGEAIDLEAFPGDFGYLLPRDGVIVHANHFESAFSTQIVDQFKARAALTLLRPERARHLLRTAIKNERVDVDGMKAVFRDHYSYPNSICRHVDPHDHPDHANCTAFSVVIDLNERIFQIAKGQPCEHEYETINLADLY